MVKPLSFKGDKKVKKRKTRHDDEGDERKTQLVKTEAEKVEEAEDATEDDGWVTADVPSDITGPIIIVLPSTPPTCIASDVNGKVFASELENLVEGDPSTSEPHDVRQVWVATRIAGSQAINFKGHHGRYLTADKYGILTASATAVSPLESFVIIPTPDTPGTFSIQTTSGDEHFLSITTSSKSSNVDVEIRGDASTTSFNTTFRIRMQARFKPKLKISKQDKAREKISRKDLEEAVGRRLTDEEAKILKRARREGNYHEEILNLRVKGKRDKYSF